MFAIFAGLVNLPANLFGVLPDGWALRFEHYIELAPMPIDALRAQLEAAFRRAGYEVTHWFGLTQPIRFVDDVGQGKISTRPVNLSLEGLFLQVGLAF